MHYFLQRKTAPDSVYEQEFLTRLPSVATSKPFCFSVGPEKREFTMHSALVASQSAALDRLVNGGFKEAQENYAELESVDEETFALFVQYAYTGQYGESAPELEGSASEQSDPIGLDIGGLSSHSLKKKNKKKKGDAIEPDVYLQHQSEEYFQLNDARMANSWQKFKRSVLALEVPAEEPHGIAIQQQINNDLLSHARVIVFADFWGVVRLRQLSLKKLGKSLEDLELTSAEAGDVACLLEYCYGEARPEELKSLCVLYAASKISKLWKSPKFQEVFSNHGDLARALMGAIVDTA